MRAYKFSHTPTHALVTQMNDDPDRGRYYLCGEEQAEYLSITNKLSRWPGKEDGLSWWRAKEPDWEQIMKWSATVGTVVHEMCERLLTNEWDPTDVQCDPDVKEEALVRFFKIEAVLSEHVEEVFNIEDMVFSHELAAAGTCDARVLWDGVPAVLDFKNKRKRPQKRYMDDYRCQEFFYAKGFEELIGISSDVGILLASYFTGSGACKADYWEFDLTNEDENHANTKFLQGVY